MSSTSPTAAVDSHSPDLAASLDVFSQAIPPSLALRLGEAAAGYVSSEGYQGSSSIYFVASYAPVQDPVDQQVDYVVFTPFSNQQQAEQLAQSLPSGAYGVFGPYSLTPTQFDEGFTSASQYVVSEASMTLASNNSGNPIAVPLPPVDWSGCDALFFSKAAVEKFAIPYYTTFYSPEFAATILTQFTEAPVALMGHLPWTEYQMDEDDFVERDPAPQHKRLTVDTLHFVKKVYKHHVSRLEWRPPAPKI